VVVVIRAPAAADKLLVQLMLIHPTVLVLVQSSILFILVILRVYIIFKHKLMYVLFGSFLPPAE
jgi:hypothetical protein